VACVATQVNLLLLAGGLCSDGGLSDVSPDPGSALPIAQTPVANITADLNGGGRLDLLIANFRDNRVPVGTVVRWP